MNFENMTEPLVESEHLEYHGQKSNDNIITICLPKAGDYTRFIAAPNELGAKQNEIDLERSKQQLPTQQQQPLVPLPLPNPLNSNSHHNQQQQQQLSQQSLDRNLDTVSFGAIFLKLIAIFTTVILSILYMLSCFNLMAASSGGGSGDLTWATYSGERLPYTRLEQAAAAAAAEAANEHSIGNNHNKKMIFVSVQKFEYTKIERENQFYSIHDFNTNYTGIIDRLNRRCFLKPLDRNVVKPPHSLFDLWQKIWKNTYRVTDSEIIRGVGSEDFDSGSSSDNDNGSETASNRKLKKILNIAEFSVAIANECGFWPVYFLNRTMMTTTTSMKTSAATTSTTGAKHQQ